MHEREDVGDVQTEKKMEKYLTFFHSLNISILNIMRYYIRMRVLHTYVHRLREYVYEYVLY